MFGVSVKAIKNEKSLEDKLEPDLKNSVSQQPSVVKKP